MSELFLKIYSKLSQFLCVYFFFQPASFALTLNGEHYIMNAPRSKTFFLHLKRQLRVSKYSLELVLSMSNQNKRVYKFNKDVYFWPDNRRPYIARLKSWKHTVNGHNYSFAYSLGLIMYHKYIFEFLIHGASPSSNSVYWQNFTGKCVKYNYRVSQ